MVGATTFCIAQSEDGLCTPSATPLKGPFRIFPGEAPYLFARWLKSQEISHLEDRVKDVST